MIGKANKTGKLYGVGVGPGDPELLTLKALRVLSSVAVIFVPHKKDEGESLARSTVAGLVPDSESKLMGLVFPMVRGEEQLTPYWQRAANMIWQHLERGEDCAFINIGDPLLYGTFLHILRILKKEHPRIPVEVVPGISSLNSSAAAALFPLATQDERIAILSAEKNEEVIREALIRFDTVVFLKVNSIFDRLMGIIEDMGMSDRCVFVRRCSTPDQEITTDMSSLKGKKLDYFSILLVRRAA
jgi:precorrin-2/cobalt-factor-2 C20-methyltransferase